VSDTRVETRGAHVYSALWLSREGAPSRFHLWDLAVSRLDQNEYVRGPWERGVHAVVFVFAANSIASLEWVKRRLNEFHFDESAPPVRLAVMTHDDEWSNRQVQLDDLRCFEEDSRIRVFPFAATRGASEPHWKRLVRVCKVDTLLY
jgi:hypothetical protein